MWGNTGIRAAILAALGFCLCATSCPASPDRIASINLCTDELLLALADPDQIAALSPYAVDPTLSSSAKQAKAFRHDASSAETVVAINPALVLGGRFGTRDTHDLLDRLGYRLVEFDVAETIADSIDQIREVASLVGHPERGEAIVAEINAALERAKTPISPQGEPTAAVYERRGYVSGGHTLTSELLSLVGITDIGRTLTGAGGGFVPLERIVSLHPDFLVVTAPSLNAEDQGSALLSHPALAELYPPEKRIVLPETLTVCGGPSLAAAIDWLSAEARRVAGATLP
jgi:iron complex transport system substrate-binding protein